MLNSNLISHDCQSWPSVSVQQTSNRARRNLADRVRCSFSLYISLSLSLSFLERIPSLSCRFSISIVYVSTLYVYTYTPSLVLGVAARTLTVLSVREVFLSLDLPPGIITSRSAQIRDYSLAYRDNRTKSARACGTSTEEIYF